MQHKEIDPLRLRDFLRLDEVSGGLYWLPRAREHFQTNRSCATWNGRYAGREAFASINNCGYRFGLLLGRYYLAHRVIWAFHYGFWPPQIDHINGDRLDNSLANLRSASFSVNAKNHRIRNDNSSGKTGVYWNRSAGKWMVGIGVNRKWLFLGYFHDRCDAEKARRTAEIEHGFHPNHGRSVA